MKHANDHTDTLILTEGQGRVYNCGAMTGKRTGVLNFFIPGGFESSMPSIVKWFEENKTA